MVTSNGDFLVTWVMVPQNMRGEGWKIPRLDLTMRFFGEQGFGDG